MLKPQALANAVTTVFAVAYIVCGLISYVAPDLLIGIAGSWLHSVNLNAIRATTAAPLGTFVFGVLTFSGYVWILTYAVTSLYNRFAK